MKTVLRISVYILVIISFSTCKKGDNDPAFSLRSRTNRLVGKWKLIDINEKIDKSYYGDHLYINITYANTKMIEKISSNWSDVVDTYQTYYKYSISFEKDETYKVSEVVEDTTYAFIGAWSWARKSKTLDLKNKEGIHIIGQTFYIDNTYETFSYTISGTLLSSDLWYIDKLKNDTLVIKRDLNYSESSTYKELRTGTRTFVKI